MDMAVLTDNVAETTILFDVSRGDGDRFRADEQTKVDGDTETGALVAKRQTGKNTEDQEPIYGSSQRKAGQLRYHDDPHQKRVHDRARRECNHSTLNRDMSDLAQ